MTQEHKYTDMHCLRSKATGQLFAYTDAMAMRTDMEPYVGPALSVQPQHLLVSEATTAATAKIARDKVSALLAEAQKSVAGLTAKSEQDRKTFTDENDVLRARLAELEGRAEAVATVASAPRTRKPEPKPVAVDGTDDDLKSLLAEAVNASAPVVAAPVVAAPVVAIPVGAKPVVGIPLVVTPADGGW